MIESNSSCFIESRFLCLKFNMHLLQLPKGSSGISSCPTPTQSMPTFAENLSTALIWYTQRSQAAFLWAKGFAWPDPWSPSCAFLPLHFYSVLSSHGSCPSASQSTYHSWFTHLCGYCIKLASSTSLYVLQGRDFTWLCTLSPALFLAVSGASYILVNE